MLRMRPPARVGCFVLLASLLLLVNARLEALAQSDSFPTSTEWEEIEKVWEEAARVWAAAEAAWPARETRTPEEWHLAEEWWRVAVGNREAQFGWLWATEVWGETIRAWACLSLSPDRPCVDPDIDYDNAWNEARRAAEGAWAAATNTALWAEAWSEIAMTETEKTQASEAAEAAWSAAEAAYAASKAGSEIDDFLPYAVNPLPDLPLPPSDRRVFWGPRSKTATAEPTPFDHEQTLKLIRSSAQQVPTAKQLRSSEVAYPPTATESAGREQTALVQSAPPAAAMAREDQTALTASSQQEGRVPGARYITRVAIGLALLFIVAVWRAASRLASRKSRSA
ncbi:MAG: hypothetical protein OXF62_11370 [Caldilineaceae bacterium]|nr:hypothetical protein [Caldilineaceae bacterium]